jgi:hypothetical protein
MEFRVDRQLFTLPSMCVKEVQRNGYAVVKSVLLLLWHKNHALTSVVLVAVQDPGDEPVWRQLLRGCLWQHHGNSDVERRVAAALAECHSVVGPSPVS